MVAEKNLTISLLIEAWRDGDDEALKRVTPLVYDELHRIADAYMRRERPGHTFTPTALVAEAFLRLSAGEPTPVSSRIQFFALAASLMRRILVDHARRRTAGKRGGRNRPITFDEATIAHDQPEELVALDEALQALAAFDERKARVVELHYFGGMLHEEIATALGLSERTVARDLRSAEAWLHRYMTDAE